MSYPLDRQPEPSTPLLPPRREACLLVGLAMGMLYLLYTTYMPILAFGPMLFGGLDEIQAEAKYQVITPQATYHNAQVISWPHGAYHSKHHHEEADPSLVFLTENKQLVTSEDTASTLEPNQTPKYYDLVKAHEAKTQAGFDDLASVKAHFIRHTALALLFPLLGLICEVLYTRHQRNSRRQPSGTADIVTVI